MGPVKGLVRIALWGSLVAISGCSILLDSGDWAAIDAGPLAEVDAAIDLEARRDGCTSVPFGMPQELVILENEAAAADAGTDGILSSVRDPTLTANQAELFFTHQSSDVGYRRIYAAQESGIDGTFAGAAPIEALDLGVSINNLQVSADGNILRFAADALLSDGIDEMYQAMRGSSGGWLKPEQMEGFVTTNELYPPRPLDDPELEVYGHRPSGTAVLASRNQEQNNALGGVNNGQGLRWPWVSQDGKVLGYVRRFTGPLDRLVLVRRVGTTSAWPTEGELESLNTFDIQEHAWYTEDLCTVYFAREIAANEYRILRAQRLPPLLPPPPE
jgi:hypothetical protein